MNPTELILERLSKVKKNGRGFTALCPAHQDRSPSLSIKEADDGKVLLHCFAGCSADDIVQSIGLDVRDLFPEGMSSEARLNHEINCLNSAKFEASVLVELAIAGGDSLNEDDLLLAAKAKQDLKRINNRLDSLLTPPQQVVHDTLFTPPDRDYVKLPDSFKRTELGKLAARIAHCIEFPEASAALALLTGASAAVSTSYAVQYVTGTPVTTGIYAVIEQPPSMMKSRLLSYAQKPYLDGVRDHNRRIAANNQGLEKDDPKALRAFDVTTDATSAGLDMTLASCNEGRFFVASAEQAAFQSLFPESGSYDSNNALLLQGWQGEYASATRKGRATFSGYASGCVLVIAQPGSSSRVFSASNGTGLAERFFYLSEPTPLGTRTHHGEYVTQSETEPFNKACRMCVDDYSRRRFDSLEVQQDPDALNQLRLTQEGYQLMLDTRRRIEPELGRLAANGELMQVGWLGKIETHTMKVAAVLHVIECLANDCKPSGQIPLNMVQTALEFVELMGQHLGQLLHDNGETGEAAEVDAVLDLVSRKPYKIRPLAQALRKRLPFRTMGKMAYTRARSRVEEMMENGRLVVRTGGVIEPG